MRLVAIKRLQGRGLSLDEIAERLAGMSAAEVEALAAIPDSAMPAGLGDPEPAPEPARAAGAFWRAVPDAVPAAAPAPAVTPLRAVRLSDTVTLLLDGPLPPLDSLRRAAAPLLDSVSQPRKGLPMSTELLPLLPSNPRSRYVPAPARLWPAERRRRPVPAVEGARRRDRAGRHDRHSTVRQRFANSGDTTIEATYVFPLPARAGVTDFVAYLAGRRVIGVLKERGQARADYEQALVSGQRAAIVEEDRPDVFSVRVGNLGPGEEATIEMVLTGPLAFEDGEATFRFPLVVAPRYTTGTPLPGDQTGPAWRPTPMRFPTHPG